MLRDERTAALERLHCSGRAQHQCLQWAVMLLDETLLYRIVLNQTFGGTYPPFC
jgi:hypothetical protein